jgi:hypothetical protein
MQPTKRLTLLVIQSKTNLKVNWQEIFQGATVAGQPLQVEQTFWEV